jgi:hypothetical protein
MQGTYFNLASPDTNLENWCNSARAAVDLSSSEFQQVKVLPDAAVRIFHHIDDDADISSRVQSVAVLGLTGRILMVIPSCSSMASGGS